jgi:hypothetical protein
VSAEPVDPSLLARVADDVRWLIDHPEFEERPPSIIDFCGPEYLNIRKHLRKRIAAELVEIFGTEFTPGHIAKYSEALITGGIGIGKTTVASVVLTYMACCTLCLKDPQDYYDLLPGSAIAFMQMSTKASQALEVIFHDTKSRIDNSPWFKTRYPRDTRTKNVIRFPKDINIIPGDSTETTFEGYNILGGVLDEMDSHKKTLTRDYAESGYSTIHARITSRFGDRGFLLLIGQMKTEGGFAMRKYEEFMARPDTYAVKLAIWESLDPERFSGPKFFYDQLRSRILHPDEVVGQGLDTSTYIEIPVEYLADFQVDPDKALRDLAGIPPKVADPFIRNADKVLAARERYVTRQPLLSQPWKDGRLAPGFVCDHGLLHYGHMDLAYSSETGDAAGLAIGHISHVVETEEGPKPYIVIDVACRIVPPPGRQLELSEVREVIYQLLARNFRIRKITLDGFQSTDTMQMLRKRRIHTDLLSVDKQLLPYQDLRDAIYEERIEFPKLIMKRKRSDPKETDVLIAELTELGYAPNGLKVDHPPGGSKDVADALAGTVHNIMQTGRWRTLGKAPASSGPRRVTEVAGEAFQHVLPPGGIGGITSPDWRNLGSPWASR